MRSGWADVLAVRITMDIWIVRISVVRSLLLLKRIAVTAGIIAGAAVVGGICLYAIVGRNSSTASVKKVLDESAAIKEWPKKIPVELGIGAVDDAMRYEDGAVELWLDNLKIEDIGKLGEEITEKIPDVPENADIWALLCVREGVTE